MLCKRSCLVFLTATLLGWGCAGDGGNGGVQANTTMSVLWGPRSRTVSAPSSALSGVVSIDPAGTMPSTDATFNRPNGEETVLQTVDLGVKAPMGSADVIVRFYAEANGEGDMVGIAGGAVVVNSDGTIQGAIATQGTVSNVRVAPNQEVQVGSTETIAASVYNEKGEMIAVSPGSIFAAIVSGNDLAVADGPDITGVKRGEAQVTVTVDGKASVTEKVLIAPVPTTYIVEPLDSASGITFVNDVSANGQVAVGSSSKGSDRVAIRWTRAGGTQEIPGLDAYDGTNIAYCVNADGSVVGGVNAEESSTRQLPWIWRGGIGTVALAMPEGIVSCSVTGITDDGAVLVGTGVTEDDTEVAVMFRATGGPLSLYEGVANDIAPDGASVVGHIKMETGEQQGFLYEGSGYFRRFITADPNVYMEDAKAISAGSRVAVGVTNGGIDAMPAFWTPSGGLQPVLGTTSTYCNSISRDGKLIGLSGGDPWLAILYSLESGMANLGRYFELVADAGGPDLGEAFRNLGIGPMSIEAISDDRMVIGGSAVPTGGTGSVRGYVVDFGGFRGL